MNDLPEGPNENLDPIPDIGSREFYPDDAAVLEIMKANRSLMQSDVRPTAKQIAYALTLGIYPTGMDRAGVSLAITDAKLRQQAIWDAERSEGIHMRRLVYLQSILPSESELQLDGLTPGEVMEAISRRHQELKEQFPVGTLVSFAKDNGTIVTGKISHFAKTPEGQVSFFLQGAGPVGSFDIKQLNKVLKLVGAPDPTLQARAQVRQAIENTAKDVLKNFPIDYSTAVRRTVKAVMEQFKRKRVSYTAVTQADIDKEIENQRGKTY